jgi:3-phosphoglycerate kinase
MKERGLVKILETPVTVVGGGDSRSWGLCRTDSVSALSTGGGATLELLAGDILPASRPLQTLLL